MFSFLLSSILPFPPIFNSFNSFFHLPVLQYSFSNFPSSNFPLYLSHFFSSASGSSSGCFLYFLRYFPLSFLFHNMLHFLPISTNFFFHASIAPFLPPSLPHLLQCYSSFLVSLTSSILFSNYTYSIICSV